MHISSSTCLLVTCLLVTNLKQVMHISLSTCLLVYLSTYINIHPCLESLIQAVGRLQTELTTDIGALGVYIRLRLVENHTDTAQLTAPQYQLRNITLRWCKVRKSLLYTLPC